MGSNRRRHPRHHLQDVEGVLTALIPVEVLNLSISGVAVRLDRGLKAGAGCTLRIQTRERGVSLAAEVAWCARADPGSGDPPARAPYTAGLMFTGAIAPEQMQLLEFLRCRRAGSEKRIGGLRFEIESGEAVFLEAGHPFLAELISVAGALLHLERQLPVDQVYAMQISLDGVGPVTLHGRATCCEEVPGRSSPNYHVGVAFEDVTPETLACLTRFIDSLES